MLVYQYHLKEKRNLLVAGQLGPLGYRPEEFKAMGDRLMPTLIHDDDLSQIAAHHDRCLGLGIGEERQVYYRMRSKSFEKLFYRSRDRCIRLGPDGTCDVIEGQAQCISEAEFDARKLIEHALHNDLFTLHYQPIVDLTTGEVKGYEALSRIEEAGRVVPPIHYLPSLLGSDLEQQWLEHELQQAVHALDYLDGFVSVNLSGSSLRWSFLPDLLKPHSPNPRLWFEVLEDATIGEAQTANLKFLRRLGHHIKLDDFPTGCDPVRKLLSPATFDGVKLDRVVCDGVANDSDLREFTASLIALAKKKGLLVVCEGIEVQADADRLRELGADYGQGWYFGKPSPL
ncbi:MAG: EAL domain-containing protein [Cyanobacteria bacterium P01_F01_bin.56]